MQLELISRILIHACDPPPPPPPAPPPIEPVTAVVPFVTTIIAKILALVDFFLSQWVDVSVSASVSPNHCWEYSAVNASVNPCGQEFLSNLTDVLEGTVALVPSLLGGLFAFGSPTAV